MLISLENLSSASPTSSIEIPRHCCLSVNVAMLMSSHLFPSLFRAESAFSPVVNSLWHQETTTLVYCISCIHSQTITNGKRRPSSQNPNISSKTWVTILLLLVRTTNTDLPIDPSQHSSMQTEPPSQACRDQLQATAFGLERESRA